MALTSDRLEQPPSAYWCSMAALHPTSSILLWHPEQPGNPDSGSVVGRLMLTLRASPAGSGEKGDYQVMAAAAPISRAALCPSS